ncbi:hypothetical protein BH24DEI1_BH24DEI1_15110 [soil metagenome]
MSPAATLPRTAHPVIGLFLFLAAVAIAAAPVPELFRSLGVTLLAYLAFVLVRASFAYLIVILAPPLGLVSGSSDWLVLQPLVISAGLLGILGLEYGWRYPALVLSPLLHLMPLLVAWRLAQTELFAVALPLAPSPQTWITLQGLVALAGVLFALYLDRRRERHVVKPRAS